MTIYQELRKEYEREVIKTFQEGLLEGKTQEMCAKITGIPRVTYGHLLRKHPDLQLVYVEDRQYAPRNPKPKFVYTPQ